MEVTEASNAARCSSNMSLERVGSFDANLLTLHNSSSCFAVLCLTNMPAGCFSNFCRSDVIGSKPTEIMSLDELGGL